MITNTKIDQSEETEWVVGAISWEFQRSPRGFFNARNLDVDIATLIRSHMTIFTQFQYRVKALQEMVL